MAKKKEIRVVRIAPLTTPEVVTIDGTLESLQHEVGGYIEAHYYRVQGIELPLICNEEGKFNGSAPNRPLFLDNGEIYDIIYGTFLVVNYDSKGNSIDVTQQQIEVAKSAFKRVLPLIQFTDEGEE